MKGFVVMVIVLLGVSTPAVAEAPNRDKTGTCLLETESGLAETLDIMASAESLSPRTSMLRFGKQRRLAPKRIS